MIRPQDSAGDIDIQACLDKKTNQDGVRRYLQQDMSLHESCIDTTTQDFICQEACLKLPDFLEVYIERGHFNKEVQDATIPEQKIVAPNGCIELIEYSPVLSDVQGESICTEVRPKTRCTYQIVAALEHKGSFAAFGHYTALARSPDTKTITRYSDRLCSTTDDESVWKNAYLLQLQIIKREDVVQDVVQDSSNTAEPQSDDSSDALNALSDDASDTSSDTEIWGTSDDESDGPDPIVSDDSNNTDDAIIHNTNTRNDPIAE